jgi:hypothetical protein
MCCCNCPCFYKARIVLLAILSVCEAICWAVRVFNFVSPLLLADEPPNFLNAVNVTDRITIAFILDWTSSIMGIFMGIFMLIFLAVLQCGCCLACVYAICRTGSAGNGKNCCRSFGCLKAAQRFISLDCNCPCYRARPKLRFRIRFAFLFICLLLRGTAIYLYKLVSGENESVSNIINSSAPM